MFTQSGVLVIISRVKLPFRLKFKFFKSLRFEIILLMIAIGIIPCIAAYVGIITAYESRAVSLKVADIQNQGIILSNQLISSNYLEDSSSAVINANLIQLTSIYNGRALIVDRDLRVIKDTYSLAEGKTMVTTDVIRGMKGEGSSFFNKQFRYIQVATPIIEEGTGAVIGVMLVTASTDPIEESIKIFRTKGGTILGIVFVLILTISLMISHFFIKPIRKITSSIEDVTEGYEDQILHVDAYIEIQQLAEAFNKMLGRLKLLDDSRQEFVSNVSHELKTPLTSMKVLSDSLLAMDEVPNELYREFMGDIAKEIDRENDIITDLLSLVKMDKKVQDLNIQAVNVNDLLELILKRLKPIAEAKNVEVVLESFRPVTAEIDEVKITLAISNLVENAIKYNYENGWVHVSLNADHKYFYVKVSDSGIGIPEEAQNHIFERFYRVDKSHSREIGGTGLGLAIARNAVIMHRGSLKLSSSEGEGATFTLRIPLSYVAG